MNITFPDSDDSTSAYLQSAFNSCICTESPYGVKEFIKHKTELAGVDKKQSLYIITDLYGGKKTIIRWVKLNFTVAVCGNCPCTHTGVGQGWYVEVITTGCYFVEKANIYPHTNPQLG